MLLILNKVCASGIALIMSCISTNISNMTTKGVLEPGKYTIVAFGDSTTRIGRIKGDVYSQILVKELPLRGIKGDIINSGIGGHNTNNAMARFKRDVLDHNPNLVIIQFGINDASCDVWKTPPVTTPRVPLNKYKKNLTEMVRTLKKRGAKVILMTPNPMRWTANTLKMYGKAPYVPTEPMGYNVILKKYAQAVRDIAAAEKVTLVDVYKLYVQYDSMDGQSMDTLLLDGIHPNEAGHRLTANALLNTIAPMPEKKKEQ